MAASLAVLALWMLSLWADGRNDRPDLPVELLEANIKTPRPVAGGSLTVDFVFRKNRDDCDNGRLRRYVWNSEGVWLKLTDIEQAKQAPAKPHPQNIRIKIPLVEAETGVPVPPGVWSLNTIIVYDCPGNGETTVLDDTIDSPPFEIIEP